MINISAVENNKKFHINLDSQMVFLRLSQYQVKRDYRFTRLYVYHEYRISVPIVFQSYTTVRVYCSIARHSYPVVCESYPIINLVKKKNNNVAGTVY